MTKIPKTEKFLKCNKLNYLFKATIINILILAMGPMTISILKGLLVMMNQQKCITQPAVHLSSKGLLSVLQLIVLDVLSATLLFWFPLTESNDTHEYHFQLQQAAAYIKKYLKIHCLLPDQCKKSNK